MPQNGKLFVLEGPDGVGKSTLAAALTDYLNSIGIPSCQLAFPGREPGTLGNHVYQIHHDPARFGFGLLNPVSLQLLHVVAHIDAITNKIIPALQGGQSIVLDRYWWSTWVYGIVSGVNRRSLRMMIDLEVEQWENILPATVFLIDRTQPLKAYESLESWNRLRVEYYELAETQRRSHPVQVIHNESTIQESLGEIIAYANRTGDSDYFDNRTKRENGKQLELNLSDNRLGVGTRPSPPIVFSSLSPAQPTVIYDTYWKFAAERQAIFFRRLQGLPRPWTNDPILAKYKFTNAYRASDRVSQFLIRNIIYNGDQTLQELFFRIMIFKVFNRIETWKLLEQSLGVVEYSSYSFEQYDDVLTKALRKGQAIFSAAYIMPSGGRIFGDSKKHRNYLKLIESMMKDNVPLQIMEMKSMREAFGLLRSYPMIGDFLAYQFITDINYSTLTNFSEMEFVVPGPGAQSGIRKCFSDLGGLNEADIIRMMADRQAMEFEQLGITFQPLFGRPLQLIDCQNLFCEVDKYSRVAHPEVMGNSGRKRIKQVYRTRYDLIDYWYPPKWGLNDKIRQLRGENGSDF